MGRRSSTTQEQVLTAINESLVARGVAPTIEELRARLGLGSKRTVLRYLKRLEAEEVIKRWKGARGLRVLRANHDTVETRSIPILGQVPAGPRMLANQNVDGWVRVPRAIARTGSQYFLLRVRGNSMNKATVAKDTIEDGDLVLVRQQTAAKNGDIVVALIDGEATIKRLVRGAGYFVLKPQSTSKHRPIIVDKDFQVQGIVARVLKQGSSLIS